MSDELRYSVVTRKHGKQIIHTYRSQRSVWWGRKTKSYGDIGDLSCPDFVAKYLQESAKLNEATIARIGSRCRLEAFIII